MTAPIQVTPVLYMADGTEYVLMPVTLGRAGIATVDVKEALAVAPPDVAAHISQYGSAALRYQYPWGGEVRAQMVVLNIPQSLVFSGSLNPVESATAAPTSTAQCPQGIETLWWRRDPDVTGFVSVANTTDTPVQASVQATGALGTPGDAVTFQLRPHATQIVDLDEVTSGIPGLENQSGGLSVHYNGVNGALMMLAGLENAREGYSATLPPYSEPPAPAASTAPVLYGAAGMMVGDADPMMGFPAGTRFTPYAVLRNLTAKAIAVSPEVYYMAGASPVAVPLPVQALMPNETRQLDLMAMFPASLKDFSGLVNLTLSYSGQNGNVAMAGGSVDQTGTYVFETNPEGLGQTMSREMTYWSIAGGSDTMISLWNSSDKPEDAVVQFYVPGGQKPYRLPIHLEPHALYNIGVMQLAINGQADANGTMLPVNSQGSAVIESGKGWGKMMEVGICAGVYNVNAGTCNNPCSNCDGVTALVITPDPPNVVPRQSVQLTLTAYYSNGNPVNVTNMASWSSSDASEATVSSSGEVTGVSYGSPTITATLKDQPVGGRFCNCLGCPPNRNFVASITAYVGAHPVNLQITSVIPTSGGVLEFNYSYGSSTGNLSDLSSCTLTETVYYPPGTNPYIWPQPPWDQATPNPSTGPNPPVQGQAGAFSDDHVPGTFVKPYQYAQFTATQTYNYSCDSGQLMGTLAGPLSIVRTVQQNGSGGYEYTITKSGHEASINPLP